MTGRFGWCVIAQLCQAAGCCAPRSALHPEHYGVRGQWHKLCKAQSVFSLTKVTMLVTLVAVLCNAQLCLEKVVTTSEQSGITMSACTVHAQIGIADWLAKGPYHDWKLQRYKCVLGKYVPKNEA
jgi:hypothetical protein